MRATDATQRRKEIPHGSSEGSLGLGTRHCSGFRDGTPRAALYELFRFPLWGQAFHDLLASRLRIRYFLQTRFVGAPDLGLIVYASATAHQPDARIAPLAFVSGRMFSPDTRESAYEQLPVPVLALYDWAAFVRVDTMPEALAHNPQSNHAPP